MSPKVSDEYKEKRRQEILIAAKRVFIQNGYEKTTMEDIITAAKSSKGGVYLYFSNKETVFLSILEHYEKETCQRLQHIIKTCNSGKEAIQQLLQIVEKTALMVQKSLTPAVMEYYMQSRIRHERLTNVKQQYLLSVTLFTSFIETGMELGYFQPMLPIKKIAKSIISFIDGLLIETLQLGPDNIQMNDHLKPIEQFLYFILQINH